MKTTLWIAITLSVIIISFLSGYIISSKTGVEPGFFEIAETGGYGVVAESSPSGDIDVDMQKYYQGLADE